MTADSTLMDLTLAPVVEEELKELRAAEGITAARVARLGPTIVDLPATHDELRRRRGHDGPPTAAVQMVSCAVEVGVLHPRLRKCLLYTLNFGVLDKVLTKRESDCRTELCCSEKQLRTLKVKAYKELAVLLTLAPRSFCRSDSRPDVRMLGQRAPGDAPPSQERTARIAALLHLLAEELAILASDEQIAELLAMLLIEDRDWAQESLRAALYGQLPALRDRWPMVTGVDRWPLLGALRGAEWPEESALRAETVSLAFTRSAKPEALTNQLQREESRLGLEPGSLGIVNTDRRQVSPRSPMWTREIGRFVPTLRFVELVHESLPHVVAALKAADRANKWPELDTRRLARRGSRKRSS